MKNIFSSALLVVAGLVSVQAYIKNAPWRQQRERRGGLADLVGALAGGGKKGEVKTVTVTNVAAVASAGAPKAAANGTCMEGTTVTIEKTVTLMGTGGSGADSGLQSSFVTMTMFESAPAPTVTETPLPIMITQQVTLTITEGNSVAGVSMLGAVGTAAEIAKPTSTAQGAVLSAAAVGSSGEMESGSLNSVAAAGAIQGTTLTTMVSPASKPTPGAVNPTLTGAAIVKITPAAAGTSPIVSNPALAAPAAIQSSVSTEPKPTGPLATAAIAKPTRAAVQTPAPAAAVSEPQASSIELTIVNTNANNALPTPAANVQPAAANVQGINISTFSLSSNIILGSLAKKTAAPEA